MATVCTGTVQIHKLNFLVKYSVYGKCFWFKFLARKLVTSLYYLNEYFKWNYTNVFTEIEKLSQSGTYDYLILHNFIVPYLTNDTNICFCWHFINNSSVSIETGYVLHGRSSISGRGKRLFSIPQYPDRLWILLNLLSNGYRGLFLQGLKWSGHESDHSLPSGAEVKNGGATPTFPLSLHGVVFN
jgi:hypothetical protein